MPADLEVQIVGYYAARRSVASRLPARGSAHVTRILRVGSDRDVEGDDHDPDLYNSSLKFE